MYFIHRSPPNRRKALLIRNSTIGNYYKNRKKVAPSNDVKLWIEKCEFKQ